MRKIYTNGCILQAPQKVIRFIKDDTLTELTQSYNSNERLFEVCYPTGSLFSQIPNAEIIADEEITLEGEVNLYNPHILNGMTFILRQSDNKYLFSCFIDTDTSELTYEENEVGGWLIVPSVDLSNNENLTQDIVTCINTNSTLFYVEAEEFEVANILGVDLAEDKVTEEFKNNIPYGSYERLYLTEADIIAGFIRECKKNYPEIEFFPQSSERKNLGKETIYYRSHISQDRSPKFNSNILSSSVNGRYFQTTIPIELYYQTSDIKQYVNRRDTYLLSHFLMDVHNFDVLKDKGYVDRWGNRTETFNFSTYWERNTVQNELMKTDANDGSGRDVYTLTMLCDLIGFIIEKSIKVVPVRQIILNLYFDDTLISTRTVNCSTT